MYVRTAGMARMTLQARDGLKILASFIYKKTNLWPYSTAQNTGPGKVHAVSFFYVIEKYY